MPSIFQERGGTVMIALETPLYLKHAAETALAQGDHMLAMDLFAEAAEGALAEGQKHMADACAFQVAEVIATMVALDGVKILNENA